VIRAPGAVGIVDAGHHTMRHTGVTLMLEHGINPRVIQFFAAWTSMRMLDRCGTFATPRSAAQSRPTPSTWSRRVTRATNMATATEKTCVRIRALAIQERSRNQMFIAWRPQRDSNPCFGLERATS